MSTGQIRPENPFLKLYKMFKYYLLYLYNIRIIFFQNFSLSMKIQCHIIYDYIKTGDPDHQAIYKCIESKEFLEFLSVGKTF